MGVRLIATRPALHPPALEVDDQVLVADDPATGGVREVAIGAAQERLDPAQELAQPERLGQVVVGAELEADDLVDLVVAGGQHEDRHLGAGRADAPKRLEPIDAGQAHVEHDEVGRLAGRDLQALLAGLGDADVVALLLEGVLDPASDGVLVFDDQDRGCHAPDTTPWRSIERAGRIRASWYPTLPLRAPRQLRPRRRAAARHRPTTSNLRFRVHAHRPSDAGRRAPRGDRQGLHRLRKVGRLPAVVYGHGVDSTNVTIDAHEFELLRRHSGPNALVDLSVDGKKAQPVLINQVQVHPVHRRPLHADLFLVRMTEELTVDVPLVATGISHAVDQLGGTVLHPTETVRVRALPDHLPQSIEYSIESLVDFDVSLHVRDLAVPSDVTLLTDADEIIAKVQPPRVEVEEEPVVAEGEEGAEGEEAAEGEAAEGGASEGGSSDSGSSEDS